MHVGQRDLAALFGGNETAQALTLGFAPAFPPAGREIVYTPATGRKPTQWEIRADGAGRIRLGQGSGADEARPAVSPDGSLVVYVSVLRHRSRLFLRRLDGTGDTVLLSKRDGANAVLVIR